MGRPTFDRQHGKFVLHDIEDGYHVELREADLARLIHEASGLLYIARLCDGKIPSIHHPPVMSPEPSIVAAPRA